MMKKLGFGLLLGALLVLTVVSVAFAITYGEPDGGEHPYVGMMLFFDPYYNNGAGGWFSCTGSLLDTSTVLTAGHCTAFVGEDLAQAGYDGGTDMWINFTEEIDLSDWPSRFDPYYEDHPDELNQDRWQWLIDSPDWIRGTAHPHPDYAQGGFPDTYDVGVIKLDEGFTPSGGPYQFATLADVGYLTGLETKRGLHKDDLIFETSGYGIQEVYPDYMAEDSRYKSTSSLVNLRSALTDGFNLHTSNNPSAANGKGGSCFGDSGGPVMINDTNVVVGVVSFGFNYNCKGADFAFRVDLANVQTWIYGWVQ
jgi:hypothetical protein